jgi:hypothetical protein
VSKIFFGKRKKTAETESQLSELGSKFDDLLEILTQNNDSETTSGQVPSDIFERIESLERRFERLHGDCLKYLQRGAKAEQRAKQLREDEEDEDYIPPANLQVATEETAEQTENDDLEWAAAQIKQRGETPIFS